MRDLKIYKCLVGEHWLDRLLSKKSVIARLFLVSVIFKYFTNKFSTILDIILWNFAVFQKSLHSPQVKRHLIFSAKNIIYVLPHKLLNHLTLRILGNQEILGKGQRLVGDRVQSLVVFPEITQKQFSKFSDFSSFTWFYYFIPNILNKIVCMNRFLLKPVPV